MQLRDDISEILLSDEEIQSKVKELGARITRAYAGLRGDVHAIVILKGAAFFASDLLRHIDLPATMDFMAISSYGSGTRSSGVVRILKDLDSPIEGRDVLIVEDIVDSGLTLKYLIGILESRRPASLKTCVLLDKPERREVEVHPDFLGFAIPDEFVVGYGLDYREKYRNLPYIGVLRRELYAG